MNVRPALHFIHRWILHSRSITARIPRYGLTMQVTPADDVGRRLYKDGMYEPEIAAALEAHVPWEEGDVFVDVGANIGWYSLLTQRLSLGRCRTVAFEPDPSNFELLRRNIALNRATRVHTINAAVGDRAGRQALHRYGKSNTGRHSLLPINHGGAVEVAVTTLDDEVDRHVGPDARVRLMKLDVEGYEVFALRGAVRLLPRCEAVLVEHTPEYLRAAGVTPADLVESLTAAGLRPFDPCGATLRPLDPGDLAAEGLQRNVLWLRRPPRVD